MSESMYKIIGKAFCSANPNYFWAYEKCPATNKTAFMIYSKNNNKILFNDSWHNFNRDVCTKYLLEYVANQIKDS